ncbi:SDR family NAD(P)-dependent oxidoreductase [Microbacterium sp. NC79]|uniref:SDR family NAD(P)-dependent oxidoreductase n=1 Tax=Microbacterium sp. NC79 TaxID=2851009 RepID=UPI001C2BB6A9|nr:SDR family NAD(P)-dependent oxidoreductase [Microbacterium sp. NC79]MBV0895526.1 SDR family NAD(P)-dependent oxidoreductase [Microbacterium sp. NC79]
MTTQRRVVLVTGASRGAGRGIAVGLAPDSVVYITGRTSSPSHEDQWLPGSLAETAGEIEAAGGVAVPVACDHGDDDQVAALFEQITRDHGRLDILVNNAIALPRELPGPRGFWEMPLDDEVRLLNVGLRSHYVSSYHAAKLMVPQGSGLIVNTSSPGARTHLPGVHTPPYGAGKAGSDKLIHDMACELEPHGVAAVGIWMGLLLTERVLANPDWVRDDGVFPGMESPWFIGRVIDALSRDEKLAARSGGIFYSSELAAAYGVTEADGTTPPSYRAWLGAPSSFTDVYPTYAEFVASEAAVS